MRRYLSSIKLDVKAATDSQVAAESMRRKEEKELRVPAGHFCSWSELTGRR